MTDTDELHDWYGPSVHAYACNARSGPHICMRGKRIDGSPEPGPHRCACREQWT